MSPGLEVRVGAVLVVAVAALAFAALSAARLDRFPPVHEDEPYIAASAARLATDGRLGNPMLTGYYGAERHVFLHPPLLPLLQAAVFRFASPGVVPMRIPSIVAGLVVLLGAIALAVRARGAACGALTAMLLVGLVLAAGWDDTSGVPLLDIARIARYDILVPALGLAALGMFERAYARSHTSAWPWLASGALAGLATLAHLYGAFWLAGMIAVLLMRGQPATARPAIASSLTPVLLLVAGFTIAVLPLVLVIASNWTEFLGQQRVLAERYRLLDPQFYVDNIVSEPLRYRPLLHRPLLPIDERWAGLALRPGLWFATAGLLVALARWLRHDIRERERTTFAIGLVLLTHVVLFALLVQVKAYSYLISVWPLAVILIAAAVTDMWGGSNRYSAVAVPGRPLQNGHTARKNRALRYAVAAALALITIEGAVRIARWQRRAGETSPYGAYMDQITASIPAGSHVLGLHQYWLGLTAFRYTTWLLPVWWSDARFTDAPVPFDTALERVAPDVILVDARMAGYFASLADPAHPEHERLLAWRRFTERHGATLLATVDNATYGSMQVWQLAGRARR